MKLIESTDYRSYHFCTLFLPKYSDFQPSGHFFGLMVFIYSVILIRPNVPAWNIIQFFNKFNSHLIESAYLVEFPKLLLKKLSQF